VLNSRHGLLFVNIALEIEPDGNISKAYIDPDDVPHIQQAMLKENVHMPDPILCATLERAIWKGLTPTLEFLSELQL